MSLYRYLGIDVNEVRLAHLGKPLIIKAAAKRADIKGLPPHDLRRTCARLCHLAVGELEQIQFLLGQVSVETTERYLGCKQRLSHAVNDNLGLEDT
jgi:integrase